jgi:hypothetical protein
LEEETKKKDVLVEILMELVEKEPTKCPCLVIPLPHEKQAVTPIHAASVAATPESEEVLNIQLPIAYNPAVHIIWDKSNLGIG